MVTKRAAYILIAHVHFPPQLAASDNLEDRFKQLEGNDVDDELEQLRRGQLKSSSKSSPKQSLPEGRPIRWTLQHTSQACRRIHLCMILSYCCVFLAVDPIIASIVCTVCMGLGERFRNFLYIYKCMYAYICRDAIDWELEELRRKSSWAAAVCFATVHLYLIRILANRRYSFCVLYRGRKLWVRCISFGFL